jgi:hypothetical protein
MVAVLEMARIARGAKYWRDILYLLSPLMAKERNDEDMPEPECCRPFANI